jgi:catecholate siderophore receptor
MRSLDIGCAGILLPAEAPEGASRPARLKGTVSVSVLSMVVAGGFGSTGQAQEATPLPPLEVTAAKPKKAPARPSPRPAASAPVAPAPAPAVEPVLAPLPADGGSGFGDGTSLTPASGNTLQSGTGLGRLPGTVQDTPQTINVISQQQIQEQNITTLSQALQNVPGVTVAIGEGGGGMNGDQFRIRGFNAKGDIYIDGLRDFGVYVRDSFAYEQVEVIKGPSSETFGMGTTGGVINIQQKTAHLGNVTTVEGIAGSGPYYRSVADVNRQLNGTTAVRLVGMFHDQDIVDRDHVYTDRWGVLGSIAFGLNTDTTWILNYLHQDGKRRPDFGVPILDLDAIAGPGGVTFTGPALGRPVTEFGVRRSNFYGKITDVDDSDVDMLTSRLSSKVNSWLNLYNDTRVAFYGREFAQTVPNCPIRTADLATYTCGDSVFNHKFNGPYGLGGPAGFTQESWGAQNVASAIAEFNTGSFEHRVVTGIDLFYQNDSRNQLGVYNKNGVLQPGTGAAVKDPTTIGNPNFYKTIYYTVQENPLARKAAEAQDVGLFISDQLWLTDTLSLLGGVRWDDYEADYRTTDFTTGRWSGGTSVDLVTKSQFTSPKGSVIWEPRENQTYYASWARSYTPQGMFITNDNNSINTTVGQNEAEPEENELWEIGAKVSTPNGKLGFTAAIFQVDKGNASFIDPFTGDTQLAGEEQRVRGVELGMTGSVTEAWIVQLAYAYLDSEILFNPASNTARQNEFKGNAVPFVSPNSMSLWTTYEFSQHMPWMRGKFLVGGGIVYADGYYTNSANLAFIPNNFTFDALMSYETLSGWRYAVNGYNLTDHLNYDAGFGNRAMPGPGPTVLATIGKKF